MSSAATAPATDQLVNEVADFQWDFLDTSYPCAKGIVGAKGSGKAQPLSEPVLTPIGFREMGGLRIGDRVIGKNGKPTQITGVFPQGKKPIYRLLMSDGTYTRATADHLWAVQTGSMKHRGGGYKILTTAQIASDLKTSQGYNKWYLPLIGMVEYKPEGDLPIPPYALGAIIGDAGLSAGSTPCLSTADKQLLDRVARETASVPVYRSGYDYALTAGGLHDEKGYCISPLVDDLRDLGLAGTRSHNKFIPESYLRASVSDRIELLRGLMDTDGTVTPVGTASFCSTSERLADQFVDLARGLGLTTQKKVKKNNNGHRDSWRIRINAPFNPFWIDRKANKFNTLATQGRTKSIQAIEFVGNEQAQCISVASGDNLYVTRDYIVTHNTFIGPRFIAQMVEDLPGSKGIFACSTNQQAEDIWEQDIKALFDELGWVYNLNQNKGIVRFWNGTLMHIRTAEKPERIESISYEWGWQDEVSLASKEFCKTIRSRIRGIGGKGHARFTSMPDDPEHFIYTYLEPICDSFHEVTLSDNPDKEFVAAYTELLKEIYTESELDRYLHGERVSLTGLGLFAAGRDHRDTVAYDPARDLYLIWDFNNIYRAVTAWQQVGSLGGLPMFNCVRSFQLKKFTTKQDAEELAGHYSGHEALVILHGDASGDNRTAAATESMWEQIKGVFSEKFGEQLRYKVPNANPNVKDTIQITNWALMKHLLYFSDDASVAYRYLVAAKSDKYGELDKSRDDQPDAPKTHEVDTIRYLAHLIYEPYWPGRKQKKASTHKMGGF